MRAIPLDHAECPPGQTEGDWIDRFEKLTERIEVEIWRRFEIDRHLRRYDIARTNRPKWMRNEGRGDRRNLNLDRHRAITVLIDADQDLRAAYEEPLGRCGHVRIERCPWPEF